MFAREENRVGRRARDMFIDKKIKNNGKKENNINVQHVSRNFGESTITSPVYARVSPSVSILKHSVTAVRAKTITTGRRAGALTEIA